MPTNVQVIEVDENETDLLALVEALWSIVEKHKGEGPTPVLRKIARRVLAERGIERAAVVRYLDDLGYDVAPREIEAGLHRGAA